MPIYEFKCIKCGLLSDRSLKVDEVEETMSFPCDCGDGPDQQAQHKRVYSFGLGSVPGGGGSPGRFGGGNG